jgi:uncharacterized protein
MAQLSKSIIEFMNQPDSYPHHPDRIEHIQTHISHIFIASPFVYKIKKPLDLGFLDFSTLEKRLLYCRRELELNRRLCDDTYLEVARLVQSGNTFQITSENGQSGTPIEFIVKMKQLKRDNFLIGIAKERKLKISHLERVAIKLHRFYSNQTPDSEILNYGKPEQIRFNTDENFNQTESFIGKTISQLAFDSTRHYTNGFLEKNDSLLRKRINEKRIVDGHGDLHLEHINLTDNSICIYDCIEFNERFRYQDIAADLAFLAMDLDFHQYQKMSLQFIDRMSQLMSDPDLPVLTGFYKCYRAYVRGKVKSIESNEKEVTASDKIKAAEKAGRYFRLALRYSLFGSKPTVYLFMGRVASGKSTLANQIAEDTDLPIYSTDHIRKEIADIPLTERLPDEERSSLYSSEMSVKTYQVLYDHGIREIRNGRSVILDGTFSSRKKREEFSERFEKAQVDYLFIEAVSDNDIRKDRLRKRPEDQSVISDARLEDMDFLDNQFENPEELDPDHLMKADTSGNIENSLKELHSKLVSVNLEKETK